MKDILLKNSRNDVDDIIKRYSRDLIINNEFKHIYELNNLLSHISGDNNIKYIFDHTYDFSYLKNLIDNHSLMDEREIIKLHSYLNNNTDIKNISYLFKDFFIEIIENTDSIIYQHLKNDITSDDEKFVENMFFITNDINQKNQLIDIFAFNIVKKLDCNNIWPILDRSIYKLFKYSTVKDELVKYLYRYLNIENKRLFIEINNNFIKNREYIPYILEIVDDIDKNIDNVYGISILLELYKNISYRNFDNILNSIKEHNINIYNRLSEMFFIKNTIYNDNIYKKVKMSLEDSDLKFKNPIYLYRDIIASNNIDVNNVLNLLNDLDKFQSKSNIDVSDKNRFEWLKNYKNGIIKVDNVDNYIVYQEMKPKIIIKYLIDNYPEQVKSRNMDVIR